MTFHSSYLRLLIVPLIAAGCQTTVNLTDASASNAENTDSGSASSGNNSGDATTDPDTTGGSDTTGKPDETTSGDTTGKPGETTSGDTTGKPGETTSGDTTTDNPGETTTTGDTTGKPDTTGGTTDDTTGGTTDNTTDNTTGGNDVLDGWTKYREVLIDNGLPTELKDFQVAIDVKYDADMSPDYADLRFTDASGTMLLPYWIEWDTGPVNAYVWVRVPVIAADDITTIRMYYGNPDVPPGSDGFDTFLFFDDFEAAQLDAVKWKTTAPAEVNFGRLLITKGSVYTAKPASDFQGTRVEARMSYLPENNVSLSALIATQGQVPGNGLPYAWHSNGNCVLFDGDKNVFQGAIWSDWNKMLIHGVGAVGGTFYYHTNRTQVPTITNSQLAFPYYIGLGHVWGKLADMDNTTDLEVDWILVRRFVKTEPTTFVGGEKNP